MRPEIAHLHNAILELGEARDNIVNAEEGLPERLDELESILADMDMMEWKIRRMSEHIEKEAPHA